MSDDLINKRLGPYQITEVIRRGGMSVVYRGHQVSLARDVAVKVLRYHHDPQFAARFTREARTIAQLQHPNILPIYDYGEQDGLLYLALQYIEHGVTLGDMLGAPMEPSAALRLVGHVLDALGYAHAHGVIHRDIKPANILMLSPTWPMLADFGIAKLMNDTQQRLTMPGLIIGTAAYMAPEQALGQPIDARTDLYSTGIVLYEMVTARVPFDADTPMVVLNKHAYEPPPSPRSIQPDLPESVEAVLVRALSKDPADRYQSAAAMAADLARVAGQIEQSRTRGQATSFYQAGVAAFEAGHWDEAVERLSRLVDLDPGYEDATELLEVARSSQEQARIAARQQLEQVRQRRQSTFQQQIDAPPPTPMSVSEPTIEVRPTPTPPITRETRRLDPVDPPLALSADPTTAPAAQPPIPGVEQEDQLAAGTAPPSRRYAPWAVGGLVVIALAVLLLRNPNAPGPAPAPTAVPPTSAVVVGGAGTAAVSTPGVTVAPTPSRAPVPTAAPTSAAKQVTPLVAGTPADPTGKLVYTDDFGAGPEAEKEKSGLEDDQQAEDFSRGFHSPGVYHFKLLRPNETHWEVLPRFAYRDFTMQIELWDNSDTFDGGVSQGLLLRVRDDDHFYALLVDPRKRRYTVRKRAPHDQWAEIIPWKASPLIKSGNEHNLVRVDAVGDQFTIYINNMALDRFQEASYAAGMVGMIVDNVDAVTPHMHFDNLKIWNADPAPTGEPLAPRQDMVAIPGGEFVMGSYQRDDQQPPHIVGVDSFYIDLTEVTNAAYEQCVDAGKCQPPADLGSYSHTSYYADAAYAAYPVINVNWEQARVYCAWAGKRLPTEAEWEKAASWNAAAPRKTTWPWEGRFDTALLNTDARLGDTAAVKQFPAELNGTFDMAGNVWEWTSSLFKPYPYSAADGREDPKAIGERVFRGGSWAQSPGTRATFRDHAAQAYQNNEIGFRCAASP